MRKTLRKNIVAFVEEAYLSPRALQKKVVQLRQSFSKHLYPRLVNENITEIEVL